MATNSSEALTAVSKTITTESRSLMQTKLRQDPINLIGSFLKDPELREFRQTARFLRFTCQNDNAKRQNAKKVRKELLPHIFNANPEAVNLFFTQPDAHPGLLLKQTYFSEGYQSQQFNKFICFRAWRNISPIQAAACCGDEFLLIELLARIVKNDEHRLRVQTQLKAIDTRISAEAIIMEAINAIIGMEIGDDASKATAKLRFDEIQRSKEFQQLMAEFLNEMKELERQWTDLAKTQAVRGISDTSSSDLKTKEEIKSSNEKTQIKYAEEMEFLAPVLRLLKAYLYYLTQYPKLASQEHWNEIDKNFELVGECHKRLPHYFKQEIFDVKPFSLNPPPTFTTSPARGPCLYWDNKPLNLDYLGFGTSVGLCKGGLATWRGGVGRWETLGAARLSFAIDLVSIAHLYKLRITGLRLIIKHLETADSAYALVNATERPRKKDA